MSESAIGSGVGRVEEGPTDSLRARMFRLADERLIPLSASVELTKRCNLSCQHCYNFDRSRELSREEIAEELPPQEIHRVIDELADAGTLYLSFTGGEALLHPHLIDFIRHARERRFVVKVKTSGVLLDRRRVAQLVDAGVAGVDVSLYGATSETHDAFTTVPGSHERTTRGIRAAREAGLPTRVNICLTSHNAAEVPSMVETVEALGCGVGVDPFLTARYDGTRSSLDHAVRAEQLAELYSGPLRKFLTEPDFRPDRSVQCACARTNCGISATGEVYPCIGAPVPSGNLRDHSFAEIWRNSPQLRSIRQLGLEDFRSCVACPARPYCKRNSGVVYSNTGDYTGPEPAICRDAEVSAAVLGDPEVVSSPPPLSQNDS